MAKEVRSRKGKRLERAVNVDHPIVQKKIDKSLKLSVKEGSLASVATGLDVSYFSPFALALNATASQVGTLYAIINLLPSLVQLKSARLIEKFSRKKIVLTGVIWKLLMLIPIFLTGVLFFFGVPYMVWAMIGFVGIYYIFTAIINPAWFSWMGSLVPDEKRGKYFSRRNRAAGFFGLLAMISGALILDFTKRLGLENGNVLGYTLIGFGILFSVAFIARIIGFGMLAKQYEPRLHVRKKDYFSFWDFLKKARKTSFGRFVLFRGIFSFVIGIAGPFWVVYMIRDLGFSYVWYMVITVASIAFQLMFLPLLGKASDRFGNIKIMTICSWLIIVIPVLWLVSGFMNNGLGVKLYLLFVPAIVSGFAWAGYNLAVNNYVYDAVKIEKRSFGLSYMNLVVGFAVFAGASLGSFLAWIDVSFMNPLLFIFAVSAIGRLLVAIFGLRFLHEVRHVKKFSSQYLVKEFRPMQGAVREIHHLEHMVKRVEYYT